MMLGARTGAWARRGGGAPTARDYVQDGIIAMWDGIENAGGGVHDAESTVWKDLVGDHDWKIGKNGSWNSDCLVVNGNSATMQGTMTDYVSAEVVLTRKSGRDAIFFGDVYHGCAFTSDFMFSWFNGSDSRKYQNKDGLTRASYSVDTSVSSFNSYYNGEKISTIKYSFMRGSSNNSIIGYAPNGASWYGDVCAIRLYNRALTAAEFAANYAIDKARFNLP